MADFKDSMNIFFGIQRNDIDPLNNGYFQFKPFIFSTNNYFVPYIELELKKCDKSDY